MAFESTSSVFFPMESIKIIGESIGIPTLSDDVSKELTEDLTFRIKSIIQDGAKFMHHAKRKKLCASDFDHSLQIKNVEPLYGIYAKQHIPFRLASGGGRELHFIEDKEMDICEVVSTPSPKFPVQLSIKPHWLAIDGVQPSIPENPTPMSKEAQKQDAVDPAGHLARNEAASGRAHCHGRGMKSVETVKVKQLATHELSAEQQLYYKEITEACVGSDEPKRAEALHSLAFDPGLHQMVPRLCTFIGEGVRVNVVQRNLALLIYLMRMAKALLDNQTLYLEKYLHEILPSVLTCIVSRQLCLKPDQDNHWALRDFAARLVSQICRNYNTTTNGIQTRITRVFARCLNADRTPLSAMYGAIAGLCELGPEVCKALMFPRVRALGDRLESCLEGVSSYEKNAATHIKSLVLKSAAPVLKSTRSAPDLVHEYKAEFGYLGPQLQAAVVKARQAASTPAAANAASAAAAVAAASAASTPTVVSATTPVLKGVGQTPRIIQHASSVGQRTFVVNKAGPATPGQPQLGQKVIIMTSKPPSSSQTTVSAVSSSDIGGGGVTSSQKFVVVSSAPSQTLNVLPQIKQEIKEEPIDVLSPQQQTMHIL